MAHSKDLVFPVGLDMRLSLPAEGTVAPVTGLTLRLQAERTSRSRGEEGRFLGIEGEAALVAVGVGNLCRCRKHILGQGNDHRAWPPDTAV
jgi:hypothetical protein